MTADVFTGRGPAAAAWPQAGADAGAATDRLLRALLCVFVATLVIEGPLRWAAALSGWPNLLYLRDAIPAGSIAVLVLRSLVVHRWLELPVLVGVSVLAAHALVGVMLGLSVFQVALGFKSVLYVLYGLAMWPLLHDRWPAVLRAAAVVYAVTLAGLAANFAVGPLPWEGMEYDTAFGAVPTTWKWWMAGGIPRLPGLARASFNAAMILGVSGVLVLVWLRRPWLRLAVALLTFAGILLTTSKGMLLAFPIAAAWLIVRGGAAHARLGRWLVLGLCGFGLVLPLAVVLLNLGGGAPQEWPDVILSAWERFSQVWPGAFELLPSGVAGLLGAGLGSIGTPQLFGFHPHLFNPGDSLAVYLLVSFGIAGALYYVLPALALHRTLAGADDAIARACVGLMVLAYGYGLSISMVEETFFATTLGFALGVLLRARSPRAAA